MFLKKHCAARNLTCRTSTHMQVEHITLRCNSPHQDRGVNLPIAVTEDRAKHKILSLQSNEGLPEEPCAMKVACTVHKVDIFVQSV